MSKKFYLGARTEPDLREEFKNTLYGKYPEIAKGQVAVLRKMRRVQTDPIITDPNHPDYNPKNVRLHHARHQVIDFFVPEEGYMVPCTCISSTTQEPDIDKFCPFCQGEGYLWDEVFVDCYKSKGPWRPAGAALNEAILSPGLINTTLMIFYVRSDIPITRADKLVELWSDEEGQPRRPYRRKALYRIGTPIDFRSDNGRIEYWELDTYEEQRKFLNGPKAG
jgi:hypothetical protein